MVSTSTIGYIISVALSFQHAVSLSKPPIKRSAEISSDVRRALLLSPAAALVGSCCVPIESALARGLVKFPCVTPLSNKYHLMRAGSSMLQEEGMLSTNPLFLTNRDDALSTTGQEQVIQASTLMQQGSTAPTLVKYSLAARCIDTVNIMGRELRLGTNSLVPEFTYMDPRAIGAWDMSDQSITIPALFALDNDEAGVSGTNGRPPPNEDGTPHETLSDQGVRLRQVMSILESQFSGETILMVFPDGTSPALLSSMIAGVPYSRCHELEYEPGEVRLDVTRDSTLALWKQRQQQGREQYTNVLRQGRENLVRLRSAPDAAATLNLKDQKIEAERVAIEEQMEDKYQADALAQEQKRAEMEEQRQQRREQAEAKALLRKVPEMSQTSSDSLLVANSAWAFGGSAAVVGSALVFNSADSGKGEESESRKQEEAEPALAAAVVAVASAPPPLAEKKKSNITTGGLIDSNIQSSPVGPIESTTGDGETSGNADAKAADKEDTMDDVRVSEGTVLSPLDEKQRKEEIAAKAMEDYLDKDDGGDDWLLSLTEIIDQEEDGDD